MFTLSIQGYYRRIPSEVEGSTNISLIVEYKALTRMATVYKIYERKNPWLLTHTPFMSYNNREFPILS
jgi:hypothetical protein